MDNLGVYVLFRSSQKTGKIDLTMTAKGKALLQLYAMQNTTPTKQIMIFERSTGNLVFATKGRKGNLPQVRKSKVDGDLGVCDDYGIGLSDLQLVRDDRFDM